MTYLNQRKIHIALSVNNLDAVVSDYSQKLGCEPEIIISDEYALWRTNGLNLSVRVDNSVPAGSLRHLGFEDPDAQGFTSSTDPVGIIWERFREEDQKNEIREIWPEHRS